MKKSDFYQAIGALVCAGKIPLAKKMLKARKKDWWQSPKSKDVGWGYRYYKAKKPK